MFQPDFMRVNNVDVQLRLKEARRDAEELQDEHLRGVPDLEHKMKKVVPPNPQSRHSSTHASITSSYCGNFTA